MTVVNVTEKHSETFSASSNRQILFPKHTTRETSFVSLFEVCVCVCGGGGGGTPMNTSQRPKFTSQAG